MKEIFRKVVLASEKCIKEETIILFPLNIFMPGHEAWKSFTRYVASLKRAEERELKSLDTADQGPVLPLNFLFHEIINVLIV